MLLSAKVEDDSTNFRFLKKKRIFRKRKQNFSKNKDYFNITRLRVRKRGRLSGQRAKVKKKNTTLIAIDIKHCCCLLVYLHRSVYYGFCFRH